ncbi:hypothetical protein Cgig2_028711 [Carnegiea gigantea]|uniref:tRNA dimethylallyltransferase 2 n=1 Tax=Carnegiea gigantea TaxID=171969 RepID=A0A9Q1KD19_9CARY|nr:hypothetical protein Cgig2_028711 [Carnegiea gigantea]
MEGAVEIEELRNPSNGGNGAPTMAKPKVVVIMGPTGSGKSKLAIDLAAHFPVEIINADSMQVYRGLDVLTNKVTLTEQKGNHFLSSSLVLSRFPLFSDGFWVAGVPHHLLGTMSPNVEFTSKDFRDAAIPLIEDIISRNHLPLIVGGTNFYIQALVSPFLRHDSAQDMGSSCLSDCSANQEEHDLYAAEDNDKYSYGRLRAVDPQAANRLHPNDHRKIRQYLELFDHSGVLPSELFQGKMMEKWGRLGVDSRYNCCFICVDASLPVLDRYVEQRVDRMIEAGLLEEVYDIYTLNADYTRGLRQAIGVREFEDFLHAFLSEVRDERNNSSDVLTLLTPTGNCPRQKLREVVESAADIPQRPLLEDGIDELKANTRRLVRRQKRRISRLQTLFGWSIQYVDSTESLLGFSEDTWFTQVVGPAAKIINAFLNSDSISDSMPCNGDTGVQKLDERDLWTQYICEARFFSYLQEACGNRVLRGAHEWEQHKQGRGHRKRIASLRKRQASLPTNSHPPQGQGVNT